MKEAKYLLVLGAQRSGTCLLAALLGGHKDISMLSENTRDDITRLRGTLYRENKLVYDIGVGMNFRANKFTHIVNRLFWVFPNSEMSVKDYIDLGAKIIVIERLFSENVNSIIRRDKFTFEKAQKHLLKCKVDLEKLNACFITLHDLTIDKEIVLRKICYFLQIEYDQDMLNGINYSYGYEGDYGNEIVRKS